VTCCPPKTFCCEGNIFVDCCKFDQACINGTCDPVPTAFNGIGGAKALSADSVVSVIRLSLNGVGVSSANEDNSFRADGNIVGNLSAFNYLTRTLVQSISFSHASGTSRGGDVSLAGAALASVNGSLRNISFLAEKINDNITFEVVDNGTGQTLAGGTGVPGLAGLGLTLTTPGPSRAAAKQQTPRRATPRRKRRP
jgi:hypothetical protein